MTKEAPVIVEPVAPKAVRKLRVGAKLEAVHDALVNQTTGFGTSRAKTHGGAYESERVLTTQELEILYKDNDLASVICDKIVEDALRGGFTLKRKRSEDEEADEELAEEILERYEELTTDLQENKSYIQRAAQFGRLFGGAGLILGVKGGGPISSELDDEDVTEVKYLVDWDRKSMVPYTFNADGTVKTYNWTPYPAFGATTDILPKEVHASRILFFPGANTTNQGRRWNQGWDYSVLQRVYNVLRGFDGMFQSIDAMFADCSQAVFKLQGLIEALAESDGVGTEDVTTRLAFMDMMRSTVRAIMLEAGDEDGKGGEEFEVVERATLGTLDGVMQQYYVRLAAAARMPLTVLLGMSPAGMDATGESDMVLYYNTVDVYRLKVLQPRILRLIRMLAQELGDEDPRSWTLCWPELARPKPLDVKTAEKMSIDAAVALVTGQIALPEEVALSINQIAPTLGLKLDKKSRQGALKDAYTEVENRDLTSAEAQHANEVELKKAGPPKPGLNATKSSKRKTPSKAAGKQV